MDKQRLDQALVSRQLATTRSQAENLIRLGQVRVGGHPVTKPGTMVRAADRIQMTTTERYVSRAGLKLASVVRTLGLDFAGKVVLDIGSSTGGFTDYALQHGARLVYAVDVGTEQLHPSLRGDARIELYEKTDIRDVRLAASFPSSEISHLKSPRRSLVSSPISASAPENVFAGLPQKPFSGADPRAATRAGDGVVVLREVPDIIVMDVSFISVRELLDALVRLGDAQTDYALMIKPQFEAGRQQVTKGVIKNDRVRRDILQGVEAVLKRHFIIIDKADSDVAGAKGNRERFYRLRRIVHLT